MTKLWKKWLARALVFALLLSLLPGGLTARAAEGDMPETTETTAATETTETTVATEATQASIQETQSGSAASAAAVVSVAFYTQEATLYETVTVTAGGALGADMPEEPAQEGYTFLGWYIGGDYQAANLVTESTTFDADTTVQACWEETAAAETEATEAAVGLTSAAGEEETVTAESVQDLIDALPTLDTAYAMSTQELQALNYRMSAIWDLYYDGLDAQEQALVDTAALEALSDYINGMTMTLETTYVAEINGTQYETLAAAIENATDGSVVSLISDVTLDSNLDINTGKSFTLDLSGYTLTGRVNITNGTKVTVQNGTMTYYNGQPLNVYASGNSSNPTTLVLASSVSITNCSYGLCVFPANSTNSGEGVNITVNGNISGNNGIFISGNIKSCSDSDIVTVNGSVIGTGTTGISVNGAENVVVSSTAEVSGTTGIEVRAGSLTVNGATVTATAASFSIEKNSNGSTTDGAAIAVVQHVTNLPTTVVVNSGTFSGVYGVYEQDIQDSTATDAVSITIAGGSFTGTTAAVYIKDSATEGVIAISGGTYSSDVSAYVIAGNTAITNDGGATYTIGVDATTAVAEVNGVGYTTLQAAIDAAGTTASTVTLLNDTTEDIEIGKEQNITLDLNGKTLTNIADHTITNYGTLTIIDSVGSGTVNNVTHAKGALVNYGTAYLNGGTFTRSAEAGTSTTDNGGNSWYTVKNYNQMAVNGATIENIGKYSSCFANGYQNASDKTSAQAITGDVTPTLTINSGTVTGGLNSVKNDDCAVLVINGGTFTNYDQSALQNHSTVTINDGSFTGGTYVLYNCGCDEKIDVGVMTINGGTFTADSSTEYILAMVSTASTASVTITGGTFDTNGTSASVFGAASGATEVTNNKVAISGGTFSQAVPEAYCASGYSPTPLLNGTYTVCNHSNVTHVAAKAATCTEDGNIEYWYCADCGRYFLDANYTNEITAAGIVSGTATGHSYSTTWSYDADSHWHACTVCNDKTDTASHTFTLVNGVYTCSVCGYVKANDTAKTPAMTVSAGSGSSVYSGKQLKYTISYYNNLNETATVTIVDQLDSGVTFVRASDGGVYDSSTHTVTWSLSAAALTQDSVTVTVKVNDSALTADSGESTPTIYNSAKVTVGSQAAASTNTVSNPVKATSGLASTGDSFPLIVLSVVAAVALAALLVLAFLGIRSRKYKGKHE